VDHSVKQIVMISPVEKYYHPFFSNMPARADTITEPLFFGRPGGFLPCSPACYANSPINFGGPDVLLRK
jgi:hypothetical protein